MLMDDKVMFDVTLMLKGLISQGNKITKAGQSLSDVKIELNVPGGVYGDFCKIVDRVKQINKKHGFGYDPELESLGNFKVGNWSELVGKCTILLPIAERFHRELEPPAPSVGGYDEGSP